MAGVTVQDLIDGKPFVDPFWSFDYSIVDEQGPDFSSADFNSSDFNTTVT